MPNQDHADAVRRAALPEVMFAADLAIALQIPSELAEAQAISGRLGRHFLVGGRVAVLRDHFLDSLQTRSAIHDSVLKEVVAPDPRPDTHRKSSQ